MDAPERVAAAERARTALAEATRPILRAFDAPRAKTPPTSTAAEDRSRIIRGGEDSAEPSSDASDSDDLDEYLDREFVAGVDAGTPVALETARDGSVSVRFHFEDAPASSSTRAAEILAAVAAADAGLGHSAAANEKDKDKDKDKDAARENTNTPVRDAAAALKRALDAAKAYAKLEDPDAAAAEAEEEASASSPLTAADLVPAHWPAVADALFLLAALVDAGLVPPRGFPPRGDARALVGAPPLAEDDSESRGGAFGASNKAAPESEPEPESEFEFEFASPRVLERGAGEPAWAASPAFAASSPPEPWMSRDPSRSDPLAHPARARPGRWARAALEVAAEMGSFDARLAMGHRALRGRGAGAGGGMIEGGREGGTTPGGGRDAGGVLTGGTLPPRFPGRRRAPRCEEALRHLAPAADDAAKEADASGDATLPGETPRLRDRARDAAFGARLPGEPRGGSVVGTLVSRLVFGRGVGGVGVGGGDGFDPFDDFGFDPRGPGALGHRGGLFGGLFGVGFPLGLGWFDAAGFDDLGDDDAGWEYLAPGSDLDDLGGDGAAQIAMERDLADRGVAEAQRHLGYRALLGRGVPRDEAEALRRFRVAADAGDALAGFNLGYMRMRGLGGEPADRDEAAARFRDAAAAGVPAAHNGLGVLRYNGWGGDGVKNASAAFAHFERGAEGGDPDAWFNLGALYQSGAGTPDNRPDATKAYECFEAASEAGHWRAPHALAAAKAAGDGTERDCAEAARLYAVFLEERTGVAEETEDAIAVMDGKKVVDDDDDDASLMSEEEDHFCLLYTSPSPRDQRGARMPSSA